MLVLQSCTMKEWLFFMRPNAKNVQALESLNYKNKNNWHILNLDSSIAADVFFIHPTTYIFGKQWNQPLDDSLTIERTIEMPLKYQASIFKDSFNLIAPSYRQAIFYSFADMEKKGGEALEYAYSDVRNAFFTYLNHFNKGRPFILAAHSQGAFHGLRLLKEIMQDSLIRSRIICSYLVGWPITKETLGSDIQVCQEKDQINCVVSWNTESTQKGFSLVRELVGDELVICVNPLNWTCTGEYVEKTNNKGAVFPNFKKNKQDIILYYCDAQIVNGVLNINRPSNRSKLKMPMGKNVYHIYDYNFFYHNIKENALLRKNQYLDQLYHE